MSLTDLSPEIFTLILRSTIELALDGEDVPSVLALRLVCSMLTYRSTLIAGPFYFITDDLLFGVEELDSHPTFACYRLTQQLLIRALHVKLSLPPSKWDSSLLQCLRRFVENALALFPDQDPLEVTGKVLELLIQWREHRFIKHYNPDRDDYWPVWRDDREDKMVLAAYFGDIDSIRQMLTDGKRTGRSGRPDMFMGNPLWAALAGGHHDIAELLIPATPHINERTTRGRSRILEAACQHPDKRIFELLLKANFNVDYRCLCLVPAFDQLIKQGLREELDMLLTGGLEDRSKLYGELLLYAIDMQQFQIAEDMIDRGAELNGRTYRERDSNTPLQDPPLTRACRVGSVEMVKRLLEAGAETSNQGPGEPPLITASALGSVEIVKTLLEHGADVNGPKYHLREWPVRAQTPLQEACLNGHLGVVACLLKAGANVRLHDLQTGTALTAAAIAGDHHIVEMLLKAGARPNERLRHVKQCSPLARACISGNERSVDMLLNYGAYVTVSGAGLDPPVQIASDLGFDDIVEILVRRGAAQPTVRPVISVRDYIERYNIVDRVDN